MKFDVSADIYRTVITIVGGLMNQEKLNRDLKIIAKTFNEMSLQDQLRTAWLIETFENDMHEIAERYDYTKPMTFELRRTDL